MSSDVPGDAAAATSTSSREDAAALKIQRAWRKNTTRPSNTLSTDARWEDAAEHAKLQTLKGAAGNPKNDPLTRWRRAAALATRLQGKEVALKQSPEEGEMGQDVKILETQHWLELTDSKHRYGSNLKYYFRRWLEEDTEDNFFKWLDRGGGKDLSLPDCPREQLEKERIIYLSAEQRQNYKVKIDEKGLLRWERNNELVDTTAGRWQDSGDGSGVVPFDASKGDAPVVRRTSFEINPITSSSSSAVSAGSEDSHNATHYVETTRKRNPVNRWIRSHLTVKGWTELLLRKTVRRNTWIYVADRKFNLYIGIKDTGTFQHSSFLAGGIVISAGLISVHKGLIHTLSPLSGHYRTKIDNFRKFVKGLEERNVDMHRAQISKAEIALWGIEHIKKFEKKKGEVEKRGKEHVKSIVDDLTPSDTHGAPGNSQWKRDVLLGRRKVSELKNRTINAIGSAAPEHSRNNDEAKDCVDKCRTNGVVDNAQDNMNNTSG